MRDAVSVDRTRGCILGLAIGDALGAPVEGLDAQQIRDHYRRILTYVDGVRAWRRKPYRWRLPGLYTDDTQQALVLADVLIRFGHIDIDRVAEYYLALATPRGGYVGAHRAVGRSFRAVLDDLERGVDPQFTGQHSAGIGAAMRIAPVPLYFQDDYDQMLQAVFDASIMTHRDCRSLAGAAAVACAIRRLLAGEIPSPAFLLRLAGDVYRAEVWLVEHANGRITSLDTHAHSISQAIARLERCLDLPSELALASIVEEANRHGPESVCKRPTQGFPPALIPTCLYLLVNTGSFEEAVQEVVNLGGDADTAGAILGALSGAEHGASSIPDHLLQGLQNREALLLWADALLRPETTELVLPDLVELERALCESEAAFRDQLIFPPRRGGGDQGAGIHHG
jgi:ADP-ribosylglycohydrolase